MLMRSGPDEEEEAVMANCCHPERPRRPGNSRWTLRAAMTTSATESNPAGERAKTRTRGCPQWGSRSWAPDSGRSRAATGIVGTSRTGLYRDGGPSRRRFHLVSALGARMLCREASSYHQWITVYPQTDKAGVLKRNLPSLEVLDLRFRVVPAPAQYRGGWICGFRVEVVKKKAAP